MPDIAFAFLIGCGASLGLAWAVARAGTSRTSSILNAGLFSLGCAYIGGRLAHLVVYRVFFGSNPQAVFQVPLGGFAWPGALMGGILGLGLYALITRQNFGRLADGLLPLLVTLPISAWLGCWLVGCAYGPTVEAWWGVMARDEWGVVLRRWPVQPVGALLCLLVLWAIDHLPIERLPDGATFGLGVLGLTMVNFFMSLLRADPSPLANGLRLETWFALIFGTAALLALVALVLLPRRSKEPDLTPHAEPPETQ